MNKSNEIALTAQIDQLRTALREVLRLMDSQGMGVTCETCGAPVNRSCIGDEPMHEPHDRRVHQVKDEMRQALLAALGHKETPA